MSESLKSSGSNSQKDSLESTYQSTMSEGDTLIELLRYSPDGSQDSYIADRIAERLEQLSELHNQLIPFINGDKSNNNKKEVEENEKQRKQTSFAAGIKTIPEKVKVASTLDTSIPMTEKQERSISSTLSSSTEQVSIDRAVKREVYVTSETKEGRDVHTKSENDSFKQVEERTDKVSVLFYVV